MAMSYKLTESYIGQSLIDGFDFKTFDPTHGFVA